MTAPTTDRERFQIGDDLYVELVPIEDIVEQDVNAQVLTPAKFDRLAENIRQRGALESLPYGKPHDDGKRVEIISGHHRVRGAKKAGHKLVPMIVDYQEMSRSELVAKQIAHNELAGEPDPAVIRQMVRMIDVPEHFLMTGLPDEFLPIPAPDTTMLHTPAAAFEWRTVTFEFLPAAFDGFKELAKQIDGNPDLIGVAPLEQFEPLAKAVAAIGRVRDIRSVGATVAHLVDVANRELAGLEPVELRPVADVPEDWVPVPLVDAMPASAAAVVEQAIEKMLAAGEATNPAQALEFIAAEFLGTS
jgi:hypothetical protein